MKKKKEIKLSFRIFSLQICLFKLKVEIQTTNTHKSRKNYDRPNLISMNYKNKCAVFDDGLYHLCFSAEKYIILSRDMIISTLLVVIIVTTAIFKMI